ncbi:MAG: BREX-1 system adenine-specific DNA-methyltransferase PglX [Schaalia hyovaginalis]|nr:BREX-1 system adenine-specific DNA-methyltransferase PglX [Schaalia hyovaginalis]
MKETFPEGKSDLFAAFIQRCVTFLRPHGFMAQVTMQSGSVAKIVKLEHAWRRLDGRNDDGFQVAPFPG